MGLIHLCVPRNVQIRPQNFWHESYWVAISADEFHQNFILTWKFDKVWLTTSIDSVLVLNPIGAKKECAYFELVNFRNSSESDLLTVSKITLRKFFDYQKKVQIFYVAPDGTNKKFLNSRLLKILISLVIREKTFLHNR